MEHLIMGTAGHIDHGKTALIKALTGIDCDTHKEEKRRGITINLGFAHMDLPSGLSLGIVDVPGHKDFVRTMVGGTSGIDFALMVVAADSGVMPQTREHLDIMEVLNIRSGLVAVTRIDLVDGGVAVMAEDEIRELVDGTFIENCPIVRVSSVTGEGLDELKQCIDEVASKVSERPTGGVCRMFVDNIFSVSGFGTVVTGSVLSGTLSAGDTAYLLPGAKKELRVRRLERHGKEVEQVVAGDRAAINLVGLDRNDVTRGMIVSDQVLHSTRMVDAKLHHFQYGREFELWNQMMLYLGTFEDEARIHLIDCNRLRRGHTALVQVHLSKPCVAQYGDRFVVRSSSGDTTLGGGEIIDASPLRHRRRPVKLIENLRKIAEGKLSELIVAKVKKRLHAISYGELANALNISRDEVKNAISNGVSEDIVSYFSGGEVYVILRARLEKMREQVLENIAAFHAQHPLEESGRTAEELIGNLGMDRESAGAAVLQLELESMEQQGTLKRVGHVWALKNHSVRMGQETTQNVEIVEKFLENCGLTTPLVSNISVEAKRHRIDDKELDQILRYLVSRKKVYFVEGNYIHASVVNRCRKMLLKALSEGEKGMTVAEFRDLVAGNRKTCLLLLAIYDAEGVTRREGDFRVLTEKGRKALG